MTTGLFDAPGYLAGMMIMTTRPADLLAQPEMVANAVRQMDQFRAELESMRAEPKNHRFVPEEEDFEADPGLARALLDDPDFVRSLVIRAALGMIDAADWRVYTALGGR